MWPVIGGLLSGGASLLSGLFGAKQSSDNTAMTIAANQQSQLEAERFNQSQTEQQMGFQRDMVANQQQYETAMSNTAYQRAAVDMKAAGLNPIAMANSGASTPSVSAPSGAAASISPQKYDYSGRQSPFAAMGPAMQQLISTATQLRTADATVDNLVEENAKIKAQTAVEKKRSDLVEAETGSTRQRTGNIYADTLIKNEALKTAINEAVKADNEVEFRKTAAGKLLDQAGLAGRKASDIVSPIGSVLSSARGVAKHLSDTSFRSRYYFGE